MVSETACYSYHASEVVSSDIDLPCGLTNTTTPYVPCCVRGDTCLSDGICSYSHSLPGGTGFYAADCTDPTFGASSCRQLCNDQTLSDIVYDNSTGLWSCCSYAEGSSTPNCTHPSNEQFQAPAPSDLLFVASLPITGTATYPTAPTSTSITTSSSVTTSPSSSPIASSDSNSSGGLSAGASAGIGVGVAVGVVAVVAGIGFLVFRRRKRRAAPPQSGGHSYNMSPSAQPLQHYGHHDYLSHQPWMAELRAEDAPQELEDMTKRR